MSSQSDTDAAIQALNATVNALTSQVQNLLNLTASQASELAAQASEIDQQANQINALNMMAEGVSTLNSSFLGQSGIVEALWDKSQNANDGDNAWMLTATALVYLMTPAVAFFYGGMVHRKNILGTLLLCFLCMAIVTVQWLLFGFSLAFGPASSRYPIGRGRRRFSGRRVWIPA
jgi:ElaB/YqjD/DUF883 family membrane-anchored ribosome-binding protein